MIVAFFFVCFQPRLTILLPLFRHYGILDDLCGKSTFISSTACYYTVPMWCCAIGHPILSAIALWTNVPLCRRPVCLCTFSHRTDIPSLSAIMPSFIPSCIWLWPSWHCAVSHRALSYNVPLWHWPSCLFTILPPCLWPCTFVPWYHRTIMPLCHCAFGHRAMVPSYHGASWYHRALPMIPSCLCAIVVISWCTFELTSELTSYHRAFNLLALYYNTISVPLCVGHHAAIIRTYHRVSVPSAIDSQLSHLPPHSSLLQTPIFGWLLCIKVIIGISF